MILTTEQVQKDLDNLPEHYKTADVDRLIRQYVKQKADVSGLLPISSPGSSYTGSISM